MNYNLNQGQGQQSYVPKIEDQNIIFYSLHPKDLISKQFLATLEKNPLLNRQFIKICVYPNFQNIRIPQKILQLNKVPVLVPAGFPEPILGEDALSWLNNNAMTAEKSNGFDYGAIDDNAFSPKFSSLADEFQQSDYNQVWNDDYNLGFARGPANKINQAFSGIKDVDRISTYDDSHENKKGISDRMMQRMNQLKFDRDREVPSAPQRIGGLDMDSSNGNTITGLMNSPMGAPQYNPNVMGGGGGPVNGASLIPQYNPNINVPQMPGGGPPGQYNPMMGGGPPGGNSLQYNPNVPSVPHMGGGNSLQYNPDPNAPIGGMMPQMNLPQNRGMPQMPQRPFADRTTGSHHGGGNFPSPMNMPGGPNGPGLMQRSSMMGMGASPMGASPMGAGPMPANF